jgi:hypothetical protein
MPLTITTDRSRYNELRRETIRVLGERTRHVVGEALIAGANYARSRHVHKKRTGEATGAKLYAYITRGDQYGAEGELRNDANHAGYIEYGTPPHQIWPKEGHGFVGPLKPSQGRRAIDDIGTHRIMLRWYVGGVAVFARMVNHPGTQPMPFMQPAANYAADLIRHETENVTFVAAAALWD